VNLAVSDLAPLAPQEQMRRSKQLVLRRLCLCYVWFRGFTLCWILSGPNGWTSSPDPWVKAAQRTMHWRKPRCPHYGMHQ